MKKSKAILMVVCAMLLVAASVMGTLAYLTSTASVTNTFSVGSVAITMDEAKVDEYGNVLYGEDHEPLARVGANIYKLVPGHTYTKDPTIHVQPKSENCWVFAKIENGLGTDATLKMNSKFKPLMVDNTHVEGVYYYEAIVPYSVDVTDLVVFTEFTFGQTANPATYENASIKVTGYAIQADGFGTAEEAWKASGFGTTTTG